MQGSAYLIIFSHHKWEAQCRGTCWCSWQRKFCDVENVHDCLDIGVIRLRPPLAARL